MQNTQLPDFVTFLLQPSSYAPVPGNVNLVQTHISYVFIGDDLVFKFKKPVDFGFLDFTTLAKRKHFCGQELLLNRRLCPSIYLGMVALEKKGNSFRLLDADHADPEHVVEYGVKMKRMPEDRMMANVIKAGELTGEMLDGICDVLVPFYAKAEGGPHIQEFGRPEKVGVNIFENFEQTETFIGGPSLSRGQFDRIKSFSEKFLQQAELFAARIAWRTGSISLTASSSMNGSAIATWRAISPSWPWTLTITDWETCLNVLSPGSARNQAMGGYVRC